MSAGLGVDGSGGPDDEASSRTAETTDTTATGTAGQ